MTIFSPHTVGSVATRRSIFLPLVFTDIRPSCGTRRSAMSMSDMILSRETTPAWILFGERITSCRTPSIRKRTRMSCSVGSMWMSEARSLIAWVMSRLTNLTIGASSTISLTWARSSSCSPASIDVVSSSSSSSPRWNRSIAAATSALVATTGRTSRPDSERMSSMAKTLPGSAIATTSLPSSKPIGSTLCRRQIDAGRAATAAPSTATSASSTKRIPIWAASAATSWLSVSRPISTKTRPRLRPCLSCSARADTSWSAVIRPLSSRTSPSLFTTHAAWWSPARSSESPRPRVVRAGAATSESGASRTAGPGSCRRLGRLDGVDDGVQQGQQHRFRRAPVGGVARDDRDLRVQVEGCAQPRPRGGIEVLGPVDRDHERHARHPPESRQHRDGRTDRLLLGSVHQQDVAQHALAQDLPHEVEPVLTRRTEQEQHQLAVDRDPAEVHRHRGLGLDRTGLVGDVLLVDGTQEESVSAAVPVLAAFRRMASVPFVVAVNRTEHVDPAAQAWLRETLDLDPEVPVIPCDATERSSVKAVLLALLYAVAETLEPAEAPA